jgi:type I restriction enzyme, R subunit
VPLTDTSEAGLEALIVRSLIDEADYVHGDPNDYDRDQASGRCPPPTAARSRSRS